MAEQQFMATLDEMRGFLRSIKPNADPILLRSIINSELRAVLDRYPVWSGLLRKKSIHIRDSVHIPEVSLTYGSRIASISGVSAPVDDYGSAILVDGATGGLLRWVKLNQPIMLVPGDSVLISGGSATEAVAVLGVDGNQIRIQPSVSFPSGSFVSRSSWAGRQIRLSGSRQVMTVMAVASASSLILDRVWDGDPVTDSAILMDAYVRIAHDVKQVIGMIDVPTRNTIHLYVSQSELTKIDPARLASGVPRMMSPAAVDPAGNLLFEIYPHQTSGREILCDYVIQWPDLEDGSDRLPPFMNPNIIMWRAAAQVLRLRVSGNDEYYDPPSAIFYEQRAAQALEEAIKADQGRSEMLISSGSMKTTYPGATYQEVAVGTWEIGF